jgi:hypothetical protein
MSDPSRSISCYLAEWYRADLSEASMERAFARLTRGVELTGDDGASATVLMSLLVPTDDVVFCVFVAQSPETVVAACDQAGIPVERVTAAVASSQIGGSDSQSSTSKRSPRATTVAPPWPG